MRAVALMEALKGGIVLGAGFGLLSLLHHDIRHAATAFVTRLHLAPDNHYAGVFLDAAAKLNDTRLWALAAFALAYSVLRFSEGYGLWFGRRWGLWLGAVSGAIYVPVEVYELWHRPGFIKVGTLLFNVAVVAYLVWTLRQKVAGAQAPAQPRS